MEMKLFTFRLKTIAIVIVTGIVFLAIGAYWGTYCTERQAVMRETEESVLRLALNLQAIKYIRERKAAEAIDALSSMNETTLFYLMRNDEMTPTDPAFVSRKRKILAALDKERKDHPVVVGDKNTSFKSDPEWQQYQHDIDRYLERNR
jgi:hypothetical protein